MKTIGYFSDSQSATIAQSILNEQGIINSVPGAIFKGIYPLFPINPVPLRVSEEDEEKALQLILENPLTKNGFSQTKKHLELAKVNNQEASSPLKIIMAGLLFPFGGANLFFGTKILGLVFLCINSYFIFFEGAHIGVTLTIVIFMVLIDLVSTLQK